MKVQEDHPLLKPITELDEPPSTKEWVIKVVESCRATVHFEYAKVVVDLYGKTSTPEEYEVMQHHWQICYNNFHHIISSY